MGGGWGHSTWKKWYDNCLSDQWKNGSKKKSDANGGKNMKIDHLQPKKQLGRSNLVDNCLIASHFIYNLAHTKSNLFMDQVEFEPAQHWSANILKADEHHSDKNSQEWL
ncbi:unnamed protein product [Prunus armeniaca]|uniref:Uncharacterized protein n=1 Tax=Prunus armeniaca TaxID=36596 RepID=A0A6J5THS8_PRUAR|nr:unnamed protein product [Prunus armeniaca]CAB4293824.1 unnamed protein product [Prunus armeniaca]